MICKDSGEETPYPAFEGAEASEKVKCCERRRRSHSQCLSACTGVVDLVDNVLKAADFIQLKMATGFIERPLQQVERALNNGLFNVSAICDGKVVGMGQLMEI